MKDSENFKSGMLKNEEDSCRRDGSPACFFVTTSKTDISDKKQKIRTLRRLALSSDFSNVVEEGGFEPPKSKTADLQSAPFGRSGTLPY